MKIRNKIRPEITEKDFIEHCYRKASLDVFAKMRKLVVPTAILLMKEELNKFNIVD